MNRERGILAMCLISHVTGVISHPVVRIKGKEYQTAVSYAYLAGGVSPFGVAKSMHTCLVCGPDVLLLVRLYCLDAMHTCENALGRDTATGEDVGLFVGPVQQR